MGSANPKRADAPVPIRCASCRRRIAWTDALQHLRNKVYCSDWCMKELAATETSERSEQWEMLHYHGHSRVAIARLYGVAHSQVYTALDRIRSFFGRAR